MVLPGGLLQIELEGFDGSGTRRVLVGGAAAEVLGASEEFVTVKVSPEAGRDGLEVTDGGHAYHDLRVGRIVAADLHPVANPVVDAQGNVYVTFSGTRGEKVPFSIFMVDPQGNKIPFLADIANPTSLAIGPDDCLYITSRHTGVVYRSTFDKRLENYVDGLGLATGLVFDSESNLYVGDRSGTIYRITPAREISVLCELEPSISAYHLITDSQDNLYVSGPTLATQDAIYRISPDGQVEVFFRGLGRPQGLQFSPQGHLQVAASYRGRKGLYTFAEEEPEWTVSGPMLVGLAYSPDRRKLYLVDNSKLYCIDL